MNATGLIDSLDRFAGVLPAVLQDVSTQDMRWKPADGAWSILEVLRHLGDEEVDDFRKRVQSTLSDPKADWPPIDPPGWAIERRYNEADPAQALQHFVSERRASVEWLRGVGNADWAIAYQHPKFGPIPAGDLLTAWSAHDYLHLRQISKRLFQIVQRDGGEFNSAYAGDWVA